MKDPVCGGCVRTLGAGESRCSACGFDNSENRSAHPQALPVGSIVKDEYMLGGVLLQNSYGIKYLARKNWSDTKYIVTEYFPGEIALRSGGGQLLPKGEENRAAYEQGLRGFMDEARSMARFAGSPGVAAVQDCFEENGTGYSVMEYAPAGGAEAATAKKKGSALIIAGLIAAAALAVLLLLSLFGGGKDEPTATEAPVIVTEAPATPEPTPVPTPAPTPEPTPEPVTILYTGKIGSIVWEIDVNGVFRLIGAGPMSNFDRDDPAPWLQYAEHIKVVIIDGSITNIPDYAFYGCYALEQLEIGYGVQTIGADSFCDCTALWEVVIPDSVEYVQSAAFYNCVNLQSLYIGSSVREIQSYAFFRCKALTAISLPLSIREIGGYAFNGCNSLETIYYDGGPRDFAGVYIGEQNMAFYNEYIYCMDPQRPGQRAALSYGELIAAYSGSSCY